MKSNENSRSRNHIQFNKKPQIYHSTPKKNLRSESTSKENGDHLISDIDLISTTSTNELNKNIIVIKLPSYIVNSHPLTNLSSHDISKKYNIQLKSPTNENLYATNHYVLLKVMTQYVYYRKLCIWIKEELKKKRSELLAFARNALIEARGSNIFNIENMPDSELTKEERDFLFRYAEESSTDSYSIQPSTKSATYSQQDKENQNDAHRRYHKKEKHKETSKNNSAFVQECKLESSSCSQHKDKCKFGNKGKKCQHKGKECEKVEDNIYESCHEERNNSLFLCDKCTESGKTSKVKGDLKFSTDVEADTCTCKTHNRKEKKNNKKIKCCSIL